MINSRRYDLDWVRVLAFLIVIYFHAAIIFIDGGLPLIQNNEVSPSLDVFVTISSQFRIALLFFVSGVGVAFARRRRNPAEFIRERSLRLLPPFLFGILMVVPPIVYTEKLFLGQFDGSYLEFYPTFFTEGIYPKGNLSWHHFWFIAYLFLYCLMGVGVFKWFDDKGRAWLDQHFSAQKRFSIYKLIVPLIAIEILLRAFFPGFRDLIHDWASFFHWFLIFLAGFVIAHNEKLLDQITQLRHISLIGAISATLFLFVFLGGADFDIHTSLPITTLVPAFVLYCVARMIMVWCAILTCVGYADRYLRATTPGLSYLNEAVFPLFILHLTIIEILGFWVVGLDWSLWLKYLVITTLTIVLVLLIYQLLIRPFGFMRLLFGVKRKDA